MQTLELQKQTTYQLVLSRGESVLETLTQFAKDKKIVGASFTGLGAVCNSVIGYYHLEKKEYSFVEVVDDREVVSLIGNIALVNGEPFIHAHITLGDPTMQLVGGHLKECEVAVTLEITLVAHDEKLRREHDASIGLNLLSL